MLRPTAILLASLMAMSSAFIQTSAAADANATCEAKAVDKNGKPLAGAAKTSFLKKCNSAAGNDCAAKAIDKNGKPLAGAAKSAFIKKCTADQNAAP
ncbi:MAG: hypothetical protein QM661_05710 [Solimonas sp.]